MLHVSPFCHCLLLSRVCSIVVVTVWLQLPLSPFPPVVVTWLPLQLVFPVVTVLLLLINVTFLPLFIAVAGLFYICYYCVAAASSVSISSRCCDLASAAAGVSCCYCSVVANKCYLSDIVYCCRGSAL